MGYRTFAPWIDESYDAEPDSDKRMRLALAEINRLTLLSQQIWKKNYEEMVEVLVHNYHHLQKRQNQSMLPGLQPLFKTESPLNPLANPSQESGSGSSSSLNLD
jgi:hypothetical protein